MSTHPVPMCFSCAHYELGLKCAAYPRGIPEEIYESTVDHRQQYAGDQGIVFEQDPDRPEPDFTELFSSQ